MATLAERLLEHGIRPRHYSVGDQKLTCPRCSAQRRNRTDPCLSLTIDGVKAIWKCHHCDWSGALSEQSASKPRRDAPVRPQWEPGAPTPATLKWLAARGISEATARRNRIGTARVYIPAAKAEVDCIAFPYFRGGELVNVKFRALDEKAFIQVKGAEALLYGLDDIADMKTIIIVEGECDKLACEEAGYRSTVSVPRPAATRPTTAPPSRGCTPAPITSIVRSASSSPGTPTSGGAPWRPSLPGGSVGNAAGGCGGRTAKTCRARTRTRR